MNTEQRIGQLQPRIYVGSLSDYNAGNLHGVWIELGGKDAEEVYAEIRAMLASSPSDEVAEEWAIHDYDEFGGISLGEYEAIEHVVTIAGLLNTPHGEAFAAWFSSSGAEVSDQLLEASFLEEFAGQHDSEAAYAQKLADEVVDMRRESEWPFTCIDWDRAWRELSFDGYWSVRSAPEGGVYIFRSC